jgi:hypothetical protein
MNQQTQQGQQAQEQMTSDRSLLSAKELDYLKDFMSWELLAMKKYADLANRCQDAEIKTMINQMGQNHLDHYNKLLTHLH